MSNNQDSQEEKCVMRCKLVLHSLESNPHAHPTNPSTRVRFGAVWEGSTEKQISENAVFGNMTPQAEFNAIIKNQEVIDGLTRGKAYYFKVFEVPEDKQPDGAW